MATVLWLSRLAFVILDVLVGVLFVMTAADFCGSVFESRVGYVLVGHVMVKSVVADEFQCQQKCLGNKTCNSFNVHPGADITKRICELNNKTRQMKPGDFKKKKGSTYYGSVKISCIDVSRDTSGHYRPVKNGKHQTTPGKNCQDIKKQGHSQGDGMYWLDPNEGSHSNAFLAFCDMTSYNGGWTMCYTTNEYAKPRTEVAYNAELPYGRDGYRTNCNNIPFTEIIFIDHQTGNKTYFKRRTPLPTTAAGNYDKEASAYGLWDGVAVTKAYSYQLLICDTSFYSGFFVSGYTNCYKKCNHWCGDTNSPYFRTASNNSQYKGVAFNTNGHTPNMVKNRLISVGLR